MLFQHSNEQSFRATKRNEPKTDRSASASVHERVVAR